jgi:hypothetical protein
MPEICTAEQADFSKAWQQNGTAKVAAFLSADELGELRTAVDASYDLLRQHADDDPPTLSEYLADHYKRWDGIWIKELRGYLEQANPGLLAQFDSVIAAAERRLRSLFDQNWRLEPNFTFIRRHRSTKHYLPWHIDADAAGIINATDYCINSWLPLDPVGDVLPSLELIPGSNKTMRITPSREGKEKARPDDWVKANVGGESWIPHAVPGRDPVRSLDVASHAAYGTGQRGAHQLRIQICPHLVTRDTQPIALVIQPAR